MKVFRESVEKVDEGMECGVTFGQGFSELKQGDILVCNSVEYRKPELVQLADGGYTLKVPGKV